MGRVAIAPPRACGRLLRQHRPKATAVVVTGPPAAGKSTAVSRLLAAHDSVLHFKVRVHFQALLAAGHPVAVGIEAQIKARDQLSDATVAWGFDNFIATGAGATHVLVEGYPRNAAQLNDMRAVAEERDVMLGGLVIFDAPDAVLRQRARNRLACFQCDVTADGGVSLTCPRCGGTLTSRPDDSPNQLASRISQFRRTRRQMEEMFRRYGKVVTLNAQRTTDELAADLGRVLACMGGIELRHER